MTIASIGVISDTHYYPGSSQGTVLEKIKKAFDNVELILHAGDLAHTGILEILSTIAPVEAVCGNMDSAETAIRIPKKKVIQFHGICIGLTHGFGSHEGFPEKLFGLFEGDNLDALVFGHTHVPFNKSVDGILCFNPGSPVKPAHLLAPTVGILTVSAHKNLSGKLVELT